MIDAIMIFITALIGAIVGLLFRRIEKRIDKIDKDNEAHREEQVKIRLAERELLLAEAHISALSARCIRGEKVNGELEKAEKDLDAKDKALEALTNRLFFEKTTEVNQ